MKRRTFIKNTSLSAVALGATSLIACTNTEKEGTTQVEATKTIQELPLQLSLAQWSLNRAFFGGKLDAKNFAAIAKNDYDFEAVEYVNGFYKEEGENEAFWSAMKRRSEEVGVKNLLIMVDEEGDLGNPDQQARRKAVENHYKWVNAAKIMGCHSIRVNAFGEGTKEEVRSALIDGMGALCEYAAQENINVLIENHGLYSSDGKWIVDIIKTVNKANFGTLPDFGNWCRSKKWGGTQEPGCEDLYDRYEGVQDFLPYAKGVSAKSYNFNEKGEDRIIDYYKMIEIVKAASYSGYIGIEYEGEELDEPEGIRKTRQLIEKAWEAKG